MNIRFYIDPETEGLIFTTMTLTKKKSKTYWKVLAKTAQGEMVHGSHSDRRTVDAFSVSFMSVIHNRTVFLSSPPMIYAANHYSPTAGD